MLLLDRIAEFSDRDLVAEYLPRSDAWYADGSGNMPGWIGIELMAQAIAAHVAMDKRRSGRPLKMGALLGARSYRISAPANARFPAGQLLRIRVREAFHDESGLAAYECSIESGQTSVAASTLKVYEPDDFGLFLQGNTQ